MIERGQFAPHQILVAAMSTWIVLFLSSLIAAAVGTGALGFQLGSVVDVIFLLQLGLISLFVFGVLTYVLGQLASGQAPSVFSGSAALLVSLLQPFAAVAGYRLYGLMTNSDIIGATLAYTPYVTFAVASLLRLGLIPNDTLHDPMVLGLVPLDGPWQTLTTAMRQIEFGLIFASFVCCLAATYLLTDRRLPGTSA